MKKAILCFEPHLEMISFHYKNLNLSSGVPSVIKDIYSITDFYDTVITIQTNVGEEYLDFLGSMENCGCDENWLNKADKLMRTLSLEDIELRVIR